MGWLGLACIHPSMHQNAPLLSMLPGSCLMHFVKTVYHVPKNASMLVCMVINKWENLSRNENDISLPSQTINSIDKQQTDLVS